MIYIPLQYFGIGDVIFAQTLVRSFLSQLEDKIVWPVLPHFVEGLSRAYPDITWMPKDIVNINYDQKEDIFDNNYTILPIRWADTVLKVPYSQCMRSKYDLYDQDWMDWKKDAMWRNDTRKQQLLYNELNPENKPYNLINTYFGSDSQFQVPINMENEFMNIYMESIPGFSLFDWTILIQNATQIHCVSSSIIYLLENLKLNATQIHLYARKPQEVDFRNVEYILSSHDYIKHI